MRQLRPSPYIGIRYLQYPEELAHGQIDFDIWTCSDTEAPAWADSSRSLPVLVAKTCADEAYLAVKLLCTIRVQLVARFEELPIYISPSNKAYRMVNIGMVMVPNGNTLDFQVYFQNRRLEKVSQLLDHLYKSNQDLWDGRRSTGRIVNGLPEISPWRRTLTGNLRYIHVLSRI